MALRSTKGFNALPWPDLAVVATSKMSYDYGLTHQSISCWNYIIRLVRDLCSAALLFFLLDELATLSF